MTTWRTAQRDLTKEARLKGLRFYDLRHHVMTRLIESGAPNGVMMSIVGHVDRRMLDRYSHVRLEAKRAALSALTQPNLPTDLAPRLETFSDVTSACDSDIDLRVT